jgi:Asp-tRNA(Asn)/Glu-tRNA(Gln) amidotransferase A subunit family amidase
LTRAPAASIVADVACGRARAVDVVDEALARVQEIDAQLHAFTEIWTDQARDAAVAVDARIAAGERPPLAGVPIAVKAWQQREDPYVARLIRAGAVPVGATSVPCGTAWQTWGLGRGGPTRNPWRADRVAGGSSAGSGAAVAAGAVALATGSDGAGSARIPAAWCGVVAVKPSAGLLPTATATAEHAPLARSVADAALYLDVVTDRRLAFREALRAPSREPGRPTRAVWAPSLGQPGVRRWLDETTVAVVHSAVEALAAAGVLEIEQAPERPWLSDPAAAWHARRANPAAAPSAAIEHDTAVLDELLSGGTVLVCPTTPAGPHGHDGPGEHLSVALTWTVNLTGHPAISLPAGSDPDGLPVGLQLIGARGHDRHLLEVAHTVFTLLSAISATSSAARWRAARVTSPASPHELDLHRVAGRDAVAVLGDQRERVDAEHRREDVRFLGLRRAYMPAVVLERRAAADDRRAADSAG